MSSDYSRMQQQYVRLTGDHQKVVKNWKEDYQKLKELKDDESRSLQGGLMIPRPEYFVFISSSLNAV